MIILLQEFKFAYPDGDLFFDRAGGVAKKIRAQFPGLERKDQATVQRNFHRAADRLEIMYGYAYAEMKCFAPQQDGFSALAAQLYDTVCNDFEIESLLQFGASIVFGLPCSSISQAQALMRPMVGSEALAKFAALSPAPEINALASEFTFGAFEAKTRLSILELEIEASHGIGLGIETALRQIEVTDLPIAASSIQDAWAKATAQFSGLPTVEINQEELESRPTRNFRFCSTSLWEVIESLCVAFGMKLKLGPDRLLIVDKSEQDTLPFLTIRLEMTGTQPIPVADFDPAAFLDNFRQNTAKEIVTKLAPHLPNL